VLDLMNKPRFPVYLAFLEKAAKIGKKIGRRIFLVNYFISAHPGAGLPEARSLARWLGRRNMSPEQVQDFLPLPLTASGVMYHTGVHPFTGEQVYSARSLEERRRQRALLQPRSAGAGRGRSRRADAGKAGLRRKGG
jgi:radical SAM superfamily enzyme YgiQ (UPF0313 family)